MTVTEFAGNDIPFIKMHGAGNDYIFIDGFSTPLPNDPERLVQRVSRRRTNVGSDGLVCLVPPPDAGSDVELRIWNADGSAAQMCGNAARCTAFWMQREKRVADICRIQIAD